MKPCDETAPTPGPGRSRSALPATARPAHGSMLCPLRRLPATPASAVRQHSRRTPAPQPSEQPQLLQFVRERGALCGSRITFDEFGPGRAQLYPKLAQLDLRIAGLQPEIGCLPARNMDAPCCHDSSQGWKPRLVDLT